ncbi:MAG: hypothetical protein KDD43_10980 [Bdellovibrionales bacterium]|nr:hypothetical protein [Bdellovibrionales bacterium]
MRYLVALIISFGLTAYSWAEATLPSIGTIASYSCKGGRNKARDVNAWTGSTSKITVHETWGYEEVSQDYELWQYLSQTPGEIAMDQILGRMSGVKGNLSGLSTLKPGVYKGEAQYWDRIGKMTLTIESTVGEAKTEKGVLGSVKLVPIKTVVKSGGKEVASASVKYSPAYKINYSEDRSGKFGTYNCTVAKVSSSADAVKPDTVKLEFLEKGGKLSYSCKGDRKSAEYVVNENKGSTLIVGSTLDKKIKSVITSNEQMVYAGLANQIQTGGDSAIQFRISGDSFFKGTGGVKEGVYHGEATGPKGKDVVRVEVRPPFKFRSPTMGNLDVIPIVSVRGDDKTLIRRNYFYSPKHKAAVYIGFSDKAKKQKWMCDLAKAGK